MAGKSTSQSLARSPISELESHLGYWLRHVSNHVSGAFQKAVESQGVSLSECVALRQLYGAGDISQGELMASIGTTKGAVSKIVQRLESEGLLTRTVSAEDSRSWRLALTRSGRALVPRLAALADANDEAFFGHLDPSARAALIDTLKRIVTLRELKGIPTE